VGCYFFDPSFAIFPAQDPSHLGIADVLASLEANCPSSRASEHVPIRSLGEKSGFTMSSSKTNHASAIQLTSASIALDNKATESSQSKLICSDITKLLISIGDQFKSDSENVATNMDDLQIGELEELILLIPENTAPEAFSAGIRKYGGFCSMQTSMAQWLDNPYDLPVGWKTA